MSFDGNALPATIITGFLGSGKTTLLNHILTQQQGLKIAVLINEFGDLGIDGDLIESADDDMVELKNGCVCCSINDNLAEAIAKMVGRKSGVDYLILETTGVAEPLPIILTFMRSEFRERLRVDSIISVGDAANFSPNLGHEQPVATSQLRYADVIVLNKCDLVTTARLDMIESRIRELNDKARIVRATRCEVPLPLILSVGLFQSDRYFDHPNPPAHRSDPHHAAGLHHHHGSSHGFSAVSFQSGQPFDAEKLQAFLERLPETVFRAKGFICVDDVQHRYLFHLVGQRFTLEATGGLPDVTNKIVFIGRDLDRHKLIRELTACQRMLSDFEPA